MTSWSTLPQKIRKSYAVNLDLPQPTKVIRSVRPPTKICLFSLLLKFNIWIKLCEKWALRADVSIN